MPSWLLSSAPADSRITRTAGRRRLAQQPRELDQHRDAGEVVVGAGHDGLARQVGHQRRR